MSKITFKSIYDGVCLALRAAFPPPAQILGCGAEQEIGPGDLRVVMLGAEQVQQTGRRYKRTPTLEVAYRPGQEDAACCAAAERLTGALESITTPEGDVLHATGCRWTDSGGLLHVQVAYGHFTYRPCEELNMGEFKLEQRG